jgi:hypothetical protein
MLEADDEGIVASPDRIRREIKCSEEDLDMLHDKGFIRIFVTGRAFITHWWAHNTIRKDRFTESIYREESDWIKSLTPLPVGFPDFLRF